MQQNFVGNIVLRLELRVECGEWSVERMLSPQGGSGI